MHRFSSVSLLVTALILVVSAQAQGRSEDRAEILEGTLRVHPKFHYRYYIDGFGDGQQCALFQVDDRLQHIKPGSLIRVRGNLASKFFGRDPKDKFPALASTWIIYMNVEHVEVIRDPLLKSAGPSPPNGARRFAVDHVIWLRVEKVTPVEGPPDGLLKLDVSRHYGKISKTASDRAKKYELQRFSILFPALPGASVKIGDLILYDFGKYTSFSDSGTSDRDRKPSPSTGPPTGQLRETGQAAAEPLKPN